MYLAIGGSFYIFIHILKKPKKIFILEHELTHSIFALIFGYKIRKLKIRNNSGSINIKPPDTSNLAMPQLWFSNTIISISPYFFPLSTIIIILLYRVITFFYHNEYLNIVYLFLFGLTFIFHIIFTIESILYSQKDFEYTGRFFSLIAIYVGNIFCIIFLLKIISPYKIIIKEFLFNIFYYSIPIYEKTIKLFQRFI